MEQSKACGGAGKAAVRADGPARDGERDGGPRGATERGLGRRAGHGAGGVADGLPGIAAPAAFQMVQAHDLVSGPVQVVRQERHLLIYALLRVQHQS